MQDTKKHISIVAIGGSIRPGNFTAKALAIAVDEIRKHKDIYLEVIDPAKIHLPLPGESSDPGVETFRNTVAKATGVILATPEYHGGYSGVLKNALDLMGFEEFEGKMLELLWANAGAIKAMLTMAAAAVLANVRIEKGGKNTDVLGARE